MAAHFLPEETRQDLPHGPEASFFRIRHRGDVAATLFVLIEDALTTFPSVGFQVANNSFQGMSCGCLGQLFNQFSPWKLAFPYDNPELFGYHWYPGCSPSPPVNIFKS